MIRAAFRTSPAWKAFFPEGALLVWERRLAGYPKRQMVAAEQLDLFSASAGAAEQLPSGRTTGPVIACNTLDDDNLVAAILNAGLRDCLALAAEAGRRRLHAAIPALEALCQRFTGFGVDRIVPEQAAALDALVMIGCPDAAQTVARLIAKRVVQGPCLRQAAAAAARLGAKLPAGAVMDLLRHHDPQIRADACRFAHPWREAIPLLRDLLDDSIRMLEGQPLVLSARWGEAKFGRFSLVIFGRNPPWK